MKTTVHFIDPVQLAQITDLQLLARTVVEGYLAGLHRSPQYGAAIEFAQYRSYVQGDDPRRVDWSLYARTDRLHVKQHQQETHMRCTILLDCSASMDYTSHAVTKFHYARMLAACLAMMLNKQNDAAGFLAYQETRIAYLPPRNSLRHFRRILIELENIHPLGKTDTEGSLHYVGDILQPRSMVILISDLLHPAEEALKHLKSLHARCHDVLVFQISDPAEQTFPFQHALSFIDAESQDELYVVPDAVREQYLQNRKNHFSRIRRECLAHEISLKELNTREPLDQALHHFIHQRNLTLQASRSKRNRPMGGGR